MELYTSLLPFFAFRRLLCSSHAQLSFTHGRSRRPLRRGRPSPSSQSLLQHPECQPDKQNQDDLEPIEEEYRQIMEVLGQGALQRYDVPYPAHHDEAEGKEGGEREKEHAPRRRRSGCRGVRISLRSCGICGCGGAVLERDGPRGGSGACTALDREPLVRIFEEHAKQRERANEVECAEAMD